mgnify:CR=1 FL=1
MNRALVGSAALVLLEACASGAPSREPGGKEIVPGRNGAVVQSPLPPARQAVKPPATPRIQPPAPTPQAPVVVPPPYAAAPAPQAERQEPTPVASRAAEVRVTAWIELLGADGSSGTPVPADRVFRSGERVRFHFRSSVAGFLSVLQFNPDGTTAALYPPAAASASESTLPAEAERVIPAPPSWLRFDQNPGTERLLFVFSQERTKQDQLIAGNDVRALGREAPGRAGAMGSKGITLETPEDPRSAPDIVATGAEGAAMVFSVTLRHE